MARRLKTKIGDIFMIPISESDKYYMQLVAFDLTQLNSDVVRIFKKRYHSNETPEIKDIIEDEVINYAHCATDFGLQLKLWSIYGNSLDVGNPSKILFRGTDDYARKEGEEPKLKSDKWYVWRINDKDFTDVKSTSKELKNSYIGLVINPLGIIEMIKGNKYPINYPEFD